MTKTEHETARAPHGSDAESLRSSLPPGSGAVTPRRSWAATCSRASLRLDATSHEIQLADGDRLCVLESIPEDWTDGDPAAVLIHGLAGCARSSLCRPASLDGWSSAGIRVVRMNLRGAGAGFRPGPGHLSRRPDRGRARGRRSGWRSGPPRRPSPWRASRWERTSRSSSPPRPRIGRSPGWTACSPPIRRSTWPLCAQDDAAAGKPVL